MSDLRPKYHTRVNRDGTKSVAISASSYALLKSKADELDCTIKSLLAVIIEKHIDEFHLEELDEDS